MKSFRFFLALIIMLTLSSCGQNVEQHTVTLKPISFIADFEYCNERYSCNCLTEDSGNVTVSFLEPDNLNGLSFGFHDGKSDITLNGISVDANKYFLPQCSAVSTICDIIKTCDGETLTKDNKNYRFCGSVDGYSFTLKTSPSGLPIMLTIPDLCICINFKNVKASKA